VASIFPFDGYLGLATSLGNEVGSSFGSFLYGVNLIYNNYISIKKISNSTLLMTYGEFNLNAPWVYMYRKYPTFANKQNILGYSQRWVLNNSTFDMTKYSYVQFEVLKEETGFFT
jgi:hypothetical protein